MIHPSLLGSAAVLALALLPAARAATTPPGVRVPASPDQPAPRRGDYRVIDHGQKLIHARCAEGGTVFVAAHPASASAVRATRGAAPPKGISAERDAALRAACQSVDYTR